MVLKPTITVLLCETVLGYVFSIIIPDTCYYVPCHVIWLAKDQSFVEGGKLAGPVSKIQPSTVVSFVSQLTRRHPCSRCDPKMQNGYAYGIFGCFYSAYTFY